MAQIFISDFYKVSDLILSVEDIEDGELTIDGAWQSSVTLSNAQTFADFWDDEGITVHTGDGSKVIKHDYILIASEAQTLTYTWDGTPYTYTIPEAGLYFGRMVDGSDVAYVASMEYDGGSTTINKIDSKFIECPKITVTSSQVSGTTITFTDAQYEILANEDTTVILFDGSAIGMTKGYMTKTADNSTNIVFMNPYYTSSNRMILRVTKSTKTGVGSTDYVVYDAGTGIDVTDGTISADVPEMTIALSQVTSQSPLQIQFTTAQAAIIEDEDIVNFYLDLTALGFGNTYVTKNNITSNKIYIHFWFGGNSPLKEYSVDYSTSTKVGTVTDVTIPTTAGNNITIASDGTISATDTTYSAGTNVSITNGVISATDTTYSDATTSASGLMSSTDKTKLDGISSGATATSVSTTAVTGASDAASITVDGTSYNIPSGGSSYTFTDGLTESSGTVSWDLNDRIKAGDNSTAGVKISKTGYTTVAQNSLYVGQNSGYNFPTRDICEGIGSLLVSNSTNNVKNNLYFTASGSIMVSTGNSNLRSTGSIAVGQSLDNDVSSSNLQIFGLGNNNSVANSMVLGKYAEVNDSTTNKAFVIGNGTSDSACSNALTVDWSGNTVIAGTVTATNIPAAPATAGTYNLQCVVDSEGAATYSWVASA